MSTLEQIAKSVGVSRKTVARALSGEHEPKYAPTEKRFKEIRKIAEELGYRPNTSAKAVRSGKFNAIGLLMSSVIHERYTSDRLFTGICSTVANHNQHLLFSIPSIESITSVDGVPLLIRELACDGLLINYTHNLPNEMSDALVRHNVPCVYMNTKRDYNCVRPDDIRAGRESAEYLLQLGHRRIAWLCTVNEQGHYSFYDRKDGYREALQAAGRQPRTIVSGARDMEHKERHQLHLDVLSSPERPTAIVTPTDKDLMSLFRAAAILGIEIPRDLSLVYIGGTPPIAPGTLVTTLVTAEGDVGQQAVEQLMIKIADPSQNFEPVVIPGRLHVGETCGPCFEA